MNRLSYPLSIFVVWHPDFAYGKQIADSIYSGFCRDVEKPLSRGIGIPVFFRFQPDGGCPIPVDTSISEKTAIVLLVDQNFFVDDDFRSYTQDLVGLIGNNVRVFPISLFDKAHEINQVLQSYQFIRAYQGSLQVAENFNYSLKKIKTELLHDCARLLMDMQPSWKDTNQNRPNSPVKLFLSHAKNDGQEITKRFKAFVDEQLKLDVFFDAVDIADGYSFEQQILDNAKESALVVFHTDDYSSREWCRIEVLVAKRNKCPIVVVHNIKEGEKRAFPYLGNVPTTVVQQDERESFQTIIHLTLLQVLNNVYQRKLLESFSEKFKAKGTEFISLGTPPELFNFIDILKKKRTSTDKLIVLYPEPPLGTEELKVLNEIAEDVQFLTPILLPTLKSTSND